MSSTRPNVLWLLTDEQRVDSMGCYGSPWARTPNLDRLAAEGALFLNAITPAPVCAPARASLITGLHCPETGIWYNVTSGYPDITPLTQVFRDARYVTATFGKQHYCTVRQAFEHETPGPVLSRHVHYFSYADGYDEAAHGVVKYPGEPYQWIFGGRFPADASETAEAQCVEAARQWLERHDAAEPFLLRVSVNAPHTPVAPPEPFDSLVDADAIALPPEAEAPSPGEPDWITSHLRRVADARCLTPEQIRDMRRYYYGQVAFVDHQFGLLLDWMRGRGLLDNTIVAFVSDHGNLLGDYGIVQKESFFEPVVKVPYVFWYPEAFRPGVRSKTPVETRSLLPTLIEAAGLEAPGRCDGLSLCPSLWSGEEPPARPAFSGFTLGSMPDVGHNAPLVMVREGHWKLSVCFDPQRTDATLTDLADDPYERVNRFGDEACRDVRERLLGLAGEYMQGRR